MDYMLAAEGRRVMGDFIYGEDLPGLDFLAAEYGPGARDQRLRGFAQGQWADAAAGSGWLALQAGDVSRPEVLGQATDDEVLGVGRAWKALEAWSFTGKLAVVRELIRRHPLREYDEPGAEAGGLPQDWDPRLHHEVAAALGISLVAAAKLVNVAWTLEARLPGIGRALDANRLDPGRVQMIVAETAVLEREDLFGRAEAIILAGLAGCRTWSELERLVQRAVITVDPQGAERRRKRAEREDARIRFWRESSGACGLAGMGLPTDEALAARAHIEARAREYQAVPIRRPIDILRVMAYLDILNNVPVAQRVAWARAEDAASKAEDAARETERDEQAAHDAELRRAARLARDKVREKARLDQERGNSGAEDSRDDDGPDDDDPDDDDPDDDDPDCGGPGGGPDSGGPDGGNPGDDRGHRPGTDGLGGGGPAGHGARGRGADGSATPDDWPTDNDNLGEEGLQDGLLPEDSCSGCQPGDCPCRDWDRAEPPCGDCGDRDCACGTQPAGREPADEQPRGSPDEGPEGRDPGEQSGSSGPHHGLCSQCGGAGGVAGLPIGAALTIPAGALEWLAEWSAEARDLGSGAGGGGPGKGGHGRSAGACPACGTWGGGSTSLPVREYLAFPLLTLLGLAARPGEAHGLGALDPGVIRDLAAAAARHPDSEFCINVIDDRGVAIGHGCCKPMRGKAGAAIFADSVTFTPSGKRGPDGGFGSWVLTLPGAPLPFIVDIDVVPVDECDHRHASAGYRPGERLRHLIQVRDGKCSFPACARHARESDFEHATPYDQGGRTCACNAHACSRSCHRVKQSSGWQVTKPRPGWTQWTTMAGRTYLQGPWRYPS